MSNVNLFTQRENVRILANELASFGFIPQIRTEGLHQPCVTVPLVDGSYVSVATTLEGSLRVYATSRGLAARALQTPVEYVLMLP